MKIRKLDSSVTTNYQAMMAVISSESLLQYNHGIEVGVRTGTFSKALLHKFPFLRMTLVDPYAPYLDVGNYQYTQEMQDKIKEEARANLLPYAKLPTGNKERIKFLYQDSAEAAKSVAEESVDFVYIDANHEYSHVLADIKTWWPKVRKGGFLCGHDFSMADVTRAITEAVDADSVVTHIYGVTGDADSWFIYK